MPSEWHNSTRSARTGRYISFSTLALTINKICILYMHMHSKTTTQIHIFYCTVRPTYIGRPATLSAANIYSLYIFTKTSQQRHI